MDDDIAFLYSILFGLILTWFFLYDGDTAPVEAPMIERCELFNSTLKSYDRYTATCENGIEFNRSAL